MASEASEALAEDRKRSKYERLHECFWDKRAVQCVIRQMLDERDDLSSIDPVSANRMEYFANQLIGAARDGKSVGNTAAIREALEYLCSISDLDLRELEVLGKRLEDTSTYGGGLVLKLVHGVRNGQKTLAKPPRNCDVGAAEERLDRYGLFCQNKCPLCENRHACHVCGERYRMKCMMVWEQMPYEAAEKGEADGSKQ